MTTKISALTIPQGATYNATAQLLVDGNPVNMTGFQARMQIRDQQSKAGALICDLSQENGRIAVSQPTLGTVAITLDSVTTAGLTPGRYFFDIEAFNSAVPPVVYRVAEGVVTVTAEITD